MMRYQRVSPDCLPLTNGKKPYLRPSPSRASSKEDAIADNGTASATSTGGGINGACTSTSSAFDGVSKGFRFRSQQDPRDPNHTSGPGPSPSRGGGDVLLQWGQRKRSRVSRAEIRSAAADDSSSSSGQGRTMSSNKLQRRSANPAMPPPPPPPPLLSGVSSGRTTNPRNGLVSSKESSGLIPARNLEDRSAANGSPSRNVGGRAVSRSVAAAAAAGAKRSPPSPDKTEKKTNGKDYQNQRQNGFDPNHNHHHHQRGNRSESTAQVQLDHETNNNNGEKTGLVEVIEWPRIYIALSRKEKEEDFLAMKGTKLPHRPRKRAKNIDKALQYCFPGMWLSDLTKSRYEVREKKSVKKQQKRRGLKGMESLDTDSE
ncbi:PREDICTED: protein FAM117B-like isoform X2 [Tarenaya hassleriana]|uniref:protein FAM117B-like isoform X1 n=1 Tax=Tarenaya hassleriana TaxID=28532 RepID=UPI00053C723C|nr:PREDICTED: protein FAM117B-like isoform X1 [Tarenaya hassleriana]XP_019058045.1 PREDICTED: protein FAM117B-like isoform X2 [Tarenaya hassleriana]